MINFNTLPANCVIFHNALDIYLLGCCADSSGSSD